MSYDRTPLEQGGAHSVTQSNYPTQPGSGVILSSCHPSERKRLAYSTVQCHSAGITQTHGGPKTLRNDRADVSQHVIEEARGAGEPEGAIRKNELKIALIEAQKLSEVSWCLHCSQHASEVAVGIQEISLQGSRSTRANCRGKSSYCGCLLVRHCGGRGYWGLSSHSPLFIYASGGTSAHSQHKCAVSSQLQLRASYPHSTVSPPI